MEPNALKPSRRELASGLVILLVCGGILVSRPSGPRRGVAEPTVAPPPPALRTPVADEAGDDEPEAPPEKVGANPPATGERVSAHGR